MTWPEHYKDCDLSYAEVIRNLPPSVSTLFKTYEYLLWYKSVFTEDCRGSRLWNIYLCFLFIILLLQLPSYLHNFLNNYDDWVQLIKMEKDQCKCLSKCALNNERLYSKRPPPISVAYGSNISPNVFLIKAAAAACMNMVRIHRQISCAPPPPQNTHT